jgi:hypothetical protein
MHTAVTVDKDGCGLAVSALHTNLQTCCWSGEEALYVAAAAAAAAAAAD